jgi:hypothetical protein
MLLHLQAFPLDMKFSFLALLLFTTRTIHSVLGDDPSPYELYPVYTANCPGGLEITTAEECQTALLSLGHLPNYFGVLTGNQYSCGCSMYYGSGYFNTVTTGCQANYAFEPVCYVPLFKGCSAPGEPAPIDAPTNGGTTLITDSLGSFETDSFSFEAKEGCTYDISFLASDGGVGGFLSYNAVVDAPFAKVRRICFCFFLFLLIRRLTLMKTTTGCGSLWGISHCLYLH